MEHLEGPIPEIDIPNRVNLLTEGPIPEIGVPNRVNLLTKLKSAINQNVPPTVWACLWLSDIEVLETLVARVENDPLFSLLLLGSFSAVENQWRIAQTCNFIDFYVLLEYGSANIL
jgi:hypothetical protein